MKLLAILAIFLFATLAFADSNLCFEGWTCTMQLEWEAGWYAHPDNGAAFFPEHLQAYRQDYAGGSGRANEPNACHWPGWSPCTSHDDWVNGWAAANHPEIFASDSDMPALPACVISNTMPTSTMHMGYPIVWDPADVIDASDNKTKDGYCPRYV